ncbi:MAG: hypothetical protein HY881_10235 [Deltaproteobacteria bacterium]|nr:hypothetical protein [Deltaproteobacteria bacterium]
MLRIILLIFASLIAGCASMPPPDTASGNPEVVLTNVKFDCVRSLFMNSFMNQGYTIRNVSSTQIVAGRTTTNSSAFWYRTYYGGPAEERVTILFYPQATPDTLRVVSTAAYVSDPATASEKVFAAEGTQEDQAQLMDMKSMIENKCRK